MMGSRDKILALAKKKKKMDMIKQGKLLLGKFTEHRNWSIELWEKVLRALPLCLVTPSGEASSGQKSKLMTLLLETNRMQTLSDTVDYRQRVVCWHGVMSDILDNGKRNDRGWCFDLYCLNLLHTIDDDPAGSHNYHSLIYTYTSNSLT